MDDIEPLVRIESSRVFSVSIKNALFEIHLHRLEFIRSQIFLFRHSPPGSVTQYPYLQGLAHMLQTTLTPEDAKDSHNPTLTDTGGDDDIRRLPHNPTEPVEDVSVEYTLESSLTGGGDGCIMSRDGRLGV
jgi:hypothetical protein